MSPNVSFSTRNEEEEEEYQDLATIGTRSFPVEDLATARLEGAFAALLVSLFKEVLNANMIPRWESEGD
jgi:hypothetical protein